MVGAVFARCSWGCAAQRRSPPRPQQHAREVVCDYEKHLSAWQRSWTQCGWADQRHNQGASPQRRWRPRCPLQLGPEAQHQGAPLRARRLWHALRWSWSVRLRSWRLSWCAGAPRWQGGGVTSLGGSANLHGTLQPAWDPVACMCMRACVHASIWLRLACAWHLIRHAPPAQA